MGKTVAMKASGTTVVIVARWPTIGEVLRKLLKYLAQPEQPASVSETAGDTTVVQSVDRRVALIVPAHPDEETDCFGGDECNHLRGPCDRSICYRSDGDNCPLGVRVHDGLLDLRQMLDDIRGEETREDPPPPSQPPRRLPR